MGAITILTKKGLPKTIEAELTVFQNKPFAQLVLVSLPSLWTDWLSIWVDIHEHIMVWNGSIPLWPMGQQLLDYWLSPIQEYRSSSGTDYFNLNFNDEQLLFVVHLLVLMDKYCPLSWSLITTVLSWSSDFRMTCNALASNDHIPTSFQATYSRWSFQHHLEYVDYISLLPRTYDTSGEYINHMIKYWWKLSDLGQKSCNNTQLKNINPSWIQQ